MNEIFEPKVEAQALQRWMRDELDRSIRSDWRPVASATPARLPRWQSRVEIARRDHYRLGDFLTYYDAEFVEAVYLAVLRRPPDAEGLRLHLDFLRSGRFSRVELLAGLRYSAEGKRENIKIRGLLPVLAVQRLYRLPVIGHLFAIGGYLLQLPGIVRGIEQHAAQSRREMRTLGDALNGIADAVETLGRDAEGRQLQLARDLGIDELQEGVRRFDTIAQGIQERSESMRTALESLRLHALAKPEASELAALADAQRALETQMAELARVIDQMRKVSR